MSQKFNLNDYETVEQRLRRFKSDHPDSQVLTDLVENTGNIGKTRWVVKASIWKDRTSERADSTGYAFEVDGVGGFANATSALENCETSAIGRALANLNYTGNKRATREEMEKVQRVEQQRAQYVAKQTQGLLDSEKAGNLEAVEKALSYYHSQDDEKLAEIAQQTLARMQNAQNPQQSDEERQAEIAKYSDDLLAYEKAGDFESIEKALNYYSQRGDRQKTTLARKTLDRMTNAASQQQKQQSPDMAQAIEIVEGQLVES